MINKKRWKTFFQIIGYFLEKNKPAFICLLFVVVLESFTPFITVILLGQLLDALRRGAVFSELAVYVLAALGLQLCCQLITGAGRQYFNQKNEFMKEIEGGWLNRKAFTMDYEYLEDVKIQELRTRGESAYLGVVGYALYEMETILAAVISAVTALMILIPLFLGSGGQFSLASAGSALALILLVSGLVWLNYRKGAVYSIREREIMNSLADVSNKETFYLDMLASPERQKDLRCFGQQEAVNRDLHRALTKGKKGFLRAANARMKKTGIDQTTFDLSGLFIYLFTGLQAVMGVITVGQVVIYASSILRLSTAVARFTEELGWMEQVFRLCEDQKKFMDLNKRKHAGTIPVEKRRDDRFSVEFEHVSFKYPETDTYVIKDLNLKFEIGEKMAIVGKNGSGKTTFIKLLCRLYDVTEGCIKVNDIDIRKYDYAEYCALFAVVFQDFQVFAFSLGENLAAGAVVETNRAVEALEKAGLGERYRALPDKLDTNVGKELDDKGITFSGGEKQKIAIARAIYKNAPFVIMDEPTAALDPEAECEVYAGFDRMVGRKTALYISHRLASCRFCQDILVFDQGRVVQRGSHEELEQQEGLYRELWNAQAQYYA